MNQFINWTTLMFCLFCGHLFSTQLGATNVALNDSLSVEINNGVDTMEILEGGALLMVDGNFAAYLWGPNGETSGIISANAEGYHWVTVTDANGCTATDSIYVDLLGFEPPIPLSVEINNGIDTLVILEGGALLMVDGDFTEYLWGPNGETTNVISANAGGYHWVTVTDANGDTATDSIYVNLYVVGVEDLNYNLGISVYPNPVDQVLFVKHLLPEEQKNIVTTTLFNQVGQKVAQFTGAIERINTRNLPVGNYFVRVEGDDFLWTEKIEIVH